MNEKFARSLKSNEHGASTQHNSVKNKKIKMKKKERKNVFTKR